MRRSRTTRVTAAGLAIVLAHIGASGSAGERSVRRLSRYEFLWMV